MVENKVKVLVSNIKSVFEKHDIEFWLDMGTLLGAVRGGKMISWDNDIDFSTWYPSPKTLKLLLEDLRKFGYDVFLEEHKISLKKTIFNVDIYLHRLEDKFAINFWRRSSITWTRLIWKYKYLAYFLYFINIDFKSELFSSKFSHRKNWKINRWVLAKLTSFFPLSFRRNLGSGDLKLISFHQRITK